MSCRPELNESIRSKLERHRAKYGLFTNSQLNDNWFGFNWWSRTLTGAEGHAPVGSEKHKLYIDWIQIDLTDATPAELEYIHKNISLAAWRKTGLVLLLEYGTKIPEEKVEAFKTAMSRPLGETVKCKTPQKKFEDILQLPVESQEKLRLITKVFEDERKPKIPKIPYLPKQFKYETPQLEPKYQEALRKLVDAREEDPNNKSQLLCATITGVGGASICDDMCEKIFLQRSRSGNCVYTAVGPSVEHALQAFNATLAAQQPEHWIKGSTEEHKVEPYDVWFVAREFKDYGLKHDKPVVREGVLYEREIVIFAKEDWHYKDVVSPLPPHNADPLEPEKYEVLKKWRESTEHCPCTFGRWTCSDCKDIFPTIPGSKSNSDKDCPCGQFGNSPVLEVADKILAKGPKQKEFEPYAAVMTRFESPDINTIIKVTSDGGVDPNNNPIVGCIKSCFPITNPDEALRILLELSGQKTMVERIKEKAQERFAYWEGGSETALDYRAAYGVILSFIAELETETKKENKNVTETK